MSFIPFEQEVATGLTVAAIDIGAQNAATKTARAQTALAVSKVFATAAAGDLQGASALLWALVGDVKDPGLALVARNIWSVGAPFLNAEAAVLAQAPLIGGTVDSVLANIGAGMAAAASAYLPPQAQPAAHGP